jgi:hypothetical protein
MGWRARVRQILNAWRSRAVETGCIQEIPSAEVLNQQPVVPASLPTRMNSVPDCIHLVRSASGT